MLKERTREQHLKLGKFDLGVSARWLESRMRPLGEAGRLEPPRAGPGRADQAAQEGGGLALAQRPDARQA